ncbi:probable L-type lectin-domain containing receptor kinase S.5 [Cornus florida]|uniref:probable L-type lectin-domain containing receptor kinase S.5 n=1 Tax=Cornus florida TaxID=4283 RepID=UPI0028A1CEBE|nr:probable L-type lectin-domain containing receptor kinase S.5 [Cornus florida]
MTKNRRRVDVGGRCRITSSTVAKSIYLDSDTSYYAYSLDGVVIGGKNPHLVLQLRISMLMLLFLSSLFSQASYTLNEPYTFTYTAFDAESCGGNASSLMCMGAVTAANGCLSLTPDHQSLQQIDPNSTSNTVGRVLHRHPVLAWPAYISTSFIVRIVTDINATGYGDGMTFIFAQDDHPSPPESVGSYLGLFDHSTQGGSLRQLAVELDTYKNEYDPDGNHVAIDTTSVSSPVAVKSLNDTGIDLKSGREIMFKIEYDGWTKLLEISVAYAGDPLKRFLSTSIILQKTVPSSVYVGFTASTGTYSETHQVLQWNFTSYELPKQSLEVGKENENKTLLRITISIVMALLLFTAFALPFVLRARRRRSERVGRKGDIEMLTRNAANAPKMFTHRQLSKATNNFSKENLLGTGGFGSVYKGVVSDPSTTIAVKRISATSNQGEKEYLAEICTIGRLRHKNLVQLQGWCHERKQLLLVYDYMPNGSLDHFIGKKDGFLDWKTRYKVLTGLASALVYLHEECDNPVVHRDVKPNNVMLDSEYNAHLGDFGLARLLQNEEAVTTMIAGTPGYLAPEVSFTGRATPESDVYSFGMVALEVVCGRRSKASFMEENSLVDSVWCLYEKGALLDCVDQKLGGTYDEEQVKRTLVVGLACLHPNYTFRPRMRKVVQIFLNLDEPLVNLPVSRPSSICVSFRSSADTTTTDFGSTIAATTRGSMESLPDEMTVQYEEE